MKIFLSSTIYDLRDLRNTVETALTRDGHQVLASDSGTIPIAPGRHSYDLCLAAAAGCDCLVAVIDSRFGGLMPDRQTSITEAEIETALLAKRRVLVFVRQAVWDAKEIYKAYIDQGSAFHPTKIVSDHQVFDLIDRLRKKKADNWLLQFHLPDDLLRQLRSQLAHGTHATTVQSASTRLKRSLARRLDRFQIRYASPDQIGAIHDFAVRHIGGAIAPADKLASWLQVNPHLFKVLEVVERTKQHTSVKMRGYYSIRPITKAAAKLLDEGQLHGAELLPAHIVPQHRKPFAAYIGGVAAIGGVAQGFLLAFLAEEVDRFRDQGVRVFYTRPLTGRGERLARRKGFFPLPLPPEKQRGVYKLTFPS